MSTQQGRAANCGILGQRYFKGSQYRTTYVRLGNRRLLSEVGEARDRDPLPACTVQGCLLCASSFYWRRVRLNRQGSKRIYG